MDKSNIDLQLIFYFWMEERVNKSSRMLLMTYMTTVTYWFKEFKRGRTYVQDMIVADRPTKVHKVMSTCLNNATYLQT